MKIELVDEGFRLLDEAIWAREHLRSLRAHGFVAWTALARATKANRELRAYLDANALALLKAARQTQESP